VRGQSTSNTAYWVCALANNQHELGAEIVADPTHTSFFRAMQVSTGVVCILDHEGIVFTRIWCSFETATAVTQAWLLLDIAVYHEWEEVIAHNSGRTKKEHNAVIITDGLTGDELKCEKVCLGRGVALKVKREMKFPLDLCNNGLHLDVKTSQASMDIDRTRILNCIANRKDHLDDAPLQTSPMYERVNARLRSIFARAGWRKAASDQPELLQTCSRVMKEDADLQSFVLSVRDCRCFSDARLQEVADAMHAGLRELDLDLYLCVKVSDQGLSKLAAAIPAGLTSMKLSLCFIRQLGNLGVESVAQALPGGLRKLTLECSGCAGLDDSVMEAITNHMPGELRVLKLIFARCKGITHSGVSALIAALPLTLRELTLSFEGCSDVYNATAKQLVDKLDELENLRCLGTNFKCTSVGDDYLRELATWRPQVAAAQHRIKDTTSLAGILGTGELADDIADFVSDSIGDVSNKDCVWAAFREWDEDGSGMVSMDEFTRLFRTLSPNMSIEDIASLFAAVDTNSDTMIDVDEFTSWLFE